MLDGKRYYAAFPDENSERLRIPSLLDALEKLEKEFRQHIVQIRIEMIRHDGTNKPIARSQILQHGTES